MDQGKSRSTRAWGCGETRCTYSTRETGGSLFFSTSGSFGRSEQYRRRVRSVVWTGDSTRYENYLGPGVPFLMEITKPSGQ
jgi:hypothetical protein